MKIPRSEWTKLRKIALRVIEGARPVIEAQERVDLITHKRSLNSLLLNPEEQDLFDYERWNRLVRTDFETTPDGLVGVDCIVTAGSGVNRQLQDNILPIFDEKGLREVHLTYFDNLIWKRPGHDGLDWQRHMERFRAEQEEG